MVKNRLNRSPISIRCAQRLGSAFAWTISLILLIPSQALASRDKWFDYNERGQREEIGRNYLSAEEYYRKAFDESVSIGTTSNEMAESLVRLATVLVVQGKFNQAEPYYQRLIKLIDQKKKDKTLSDEVLIWVEDLAEDYCTFSKGDNTISGLQHAFTLRDLMNGDNAPYLQMNLRDLVGAFVAANRIAEAEPYSTRLVKLDQKKKSNFKPQVAGDIYMLGLIEYRLCKFTEAESYTRQALAMYGNCEIPPNLATANCLIQLSNILKWKKDFRGASDPAKRALQIMERAKGKMALDTVPARECYAEILGLDKKYVESMHQYEDLVSLLMAKPGAMDIRLPAALAHLKQACIKANNATRAKEVDKLIAQFSSKMKKNKHSSKSTIYR